MIRYLRQDEKARSRDLWEEAFPEDSRSFDDYYFTEKIKDNRILVKEEQGRILSMIHLNPYAVRVKDRVFRLDYIVGVATSLRDRKQGHMRDLLHRMLRDMYQEGAPFTFLMPADRRIYEPFDFAFIFDQPKWKIREGLILNPRPMSMENPAQVERVAQWVNGWLADQYQVYCLRDRGYMERFSRELASEQGCLELLYEDAHGPDGGQFSRDLAGVRAEWGVSEREVRTLMCRPGCSGEDEPPKPAIMARIVDLAQMARAVCLRRDWDPDPEASCETIGIEVDDPIIPENRGRFIWSLTRESSWLAPAEEENQGGADRGRTGEFHKVSVSQLTSWIFGYEAFPQWAQMVQPLQGVYLDEIV